MGYKDNADFNAAKNIRNRVLVTVLRESLLKQLDNGAFEPRNLKREKVKEVLLSFRRSLATQGSERTKSSVTILTMFNSSDDGTLSFVPTCPRELYDFQLKSMDDYRKVLRIRASIEGVELPLC